MRSFFSFSLVLFVFFALTISGWGAEFYVSDPAQFQNALTQAQANGEDDTIYLAPGTYNVTATLTYEADDGDGSLTIQAQDPDNPPVLDGARDVNILWIDNDKDGDLRGDTSQVITIKNIVFTHSFCNDGHCVTYNQKGLYIRTGEANVVIEGCTFRKNTAGTGAGVEIFARHASLIEIRNNTFDSNRTSGTSGVGASGIFISAAEATVNVVSNTFVNNSSYNGVGGARIYACSQANVLDNVFQENNGAYDAGILISGSSHVKNNRFMRNTGGFALRVILSHCNETLVEDNVFEQNQGGGAQVSIPWEVSSSPEAIKVTVRHNTFKDNFINASHSAAGLSVIDGTCIGEVLIDGNLFIHNFNNIPYYSGMMYAGGGMYVSRGGIYSSCLNPPKNLVISNNIFYENRSPIGGGISVYNLLQGNVGTTPQIILVSNTFLNNRATEGGNIYVRLTNDESRIAIYNNIIYDDDDTAVAGDDLYIESDGNRNGVGAYVELFNNDFADDALFEPSGGYLDSLAIYITDTDNYTHGGNIKGDPGLVDPANEDFHLTVGSICIDAGDNEAPGLPEEDFEGDTRIMNEVVDIGADELLGRVVYDLTIEPVPEHGAVLMPEDGSQINCGLGGEDCEESYLHDTEVTLYAQPEGGYVFAGWGGDCASCGNEAECTIVMDDDKTCTALFEEAPNNPPNPPSNPQPEDGGIGIPYDQVEFTWEATDPDGDALTYNFYFGEMNEEFCEPVLAAEGLASPSYGKEGLKPSTTYCWKVEACDGETCTEGPVWFFTTEAAPVYYGLTVLVDPEEGGVVTGEGINCPGDCSEDYGEGTEVTLMAQPAEGYIFTGWDGDCAVCDGPTCTIVMDADKNCTAEFEEAQVAMPDLVVTKLVTPHYWRYGRKVRVSVMIENRGDADVTEPFVVKVYANPMAPVYVLGEQVVNGLAAGEKKLVRFKFTVPNDLCYPTNQHTLHAVVDADNDIVENNEENNEATKAIIIRGCPLKI